MKTLHSSLCPCGSVVLCRDHKHEGSEYNLLVPSSLAETHEGRVLLSIP